MPAIILALIPLFIQLAGFVIKYFVKDEELTREFEIFAEKARLGNIKGIIQRRKAEERLKANNAKWDKIEAEEAAKKKGKK